MTPENIDIFYYSLTGNVERFLNKCEVQAYSIDAQIKPYRPFVLVTNTLGFGEVPAPVRSFLEKHSRLLTGVASSGNRNWGDNFGKAGRIISRQYNVPLLLVFELSGTKRDVERFKQIINEIDEEANE